MGRGNEGKEADWLISDICGFVTIVFQGYDGSVAAGTDEFDALHDVASLVDQDLRQVIIPADRLNPLRNP